MKKLFLLIAVITALFTAACGKSGKSGWNGRTGPKGPCQPNLRPVSAILRSALP